MKNNSNKTRGFGLMGIAFVVLFIIKLVFPESISWWIVFVPVFISIGLYVIGIVVLGLLYIIMASKSRKREYKKRLRIL